MSDEAIRAEIEEALRNTPVNPVESPLPQYSTGPQAQHRLVVDSVESSYEKPMEVTCHVEEVDHPPHYLNRNASIVLSEHAAEVFTQDGIIYRPVECIELMRRIKDPRIAHAWSYIWRIAFGGKIDDSQDAEKARWYLNDFFEHPPVEL